MNNVIIIAFLFAFIEGQGTSITPCKCTQLLSQGDCTNSPLGCIWNSTKKDCAEYIETITPTLSYAQYCDNFFQTQCSQIIGCAWVNGKCTFFTGCTPFAKTQNIDCQTISIKCITDGTHCVEVTTCNSFVKETSCFKNQSGNYCYWDTVNKICVDANTCDRLPSILTTDSLCRHQILTCTTTGKGCIQSATNCSDQNTEISCFWNQDKTQACYWTGTTCVEFKCDNAPKTLTTDEACKKFIPNGTCTTQQGGGCTTRSTCQAVKIEAACIKDSKGLICFWNGTACVDKTCANASRTLKSNSECQEYLSTCITNGTGCVTNTTCSSAFLQIACVINAAGIPCIWDVYCKEKTCANAPTKHNSHTLCTSFLPKCTVNASSNGCTNRTCENAPTSLISNTDCETYLPNSKCIAKTEGGCVTNTICEAITVQRACITDAKGKICFWDPSGSGSCKDKTCVNAPNTYTDDAACSSYLKTCTVASGGSGCVNRTCENLLTSALCTIDLNNKPCIYKGLCYKKECTLAPSSFNTHSDCNGYLGSCTLSNTGLGCVPIPLVCSAITKLEACYLKKVINPTTGVITYAKCGWNGQKCIDLECSTLGLTSKTTAQCEELYSGHYCVSANPVNGVVIGCIDLPTTCAQRKTKDNCEVAKSGIPNCIWNSKLPIPTCVYKSCETASAAGTTGVLKIFTNINCQAYLNTCIANNKANGCMSKPNDCSSLTSSANCGDGSKTTGDCYWNGTCVDKTCVNIQGASHIQCNTKSNLCTVKADGKGCTNLEETCSAYITSNQCYLNSSNRLCKWTGTLCRNANCNDAPDNNIYDSDSKCFNWPTVEETCTVLYKIGGKGCVTRLPNCSDYTSQTQCVRTLTASIDDCQWYSSASLCLDKAFFLTKACDKLNGTQMQCESYKVGCTNNVKAVETDACTFVCSKKVVTDHIV